MFLAPRFSSGDVEQAGIVNDRFGKRALRVIAVMLRRRRTARYFF